MSETFKPDLANLGPLPYVHTNVMAHVVSFPGWMSEPLRAAIRSLIEHRAEKIEGLKGGVEMVRTFDQHMEGTFDVAACQGDTPVVFYWPEYKDKIVQKTLSAWLIEAVKARGDDPKCDVGFDVMFIEPNNTHTGVVNAWLGKQLLPTHGGEMESTREIAKPLEVQETVLGSDGLNNYNPQARQLSAHFHRVVMDGAIQSGSYGNDAVVKLAQEILQHLTKNPYIVEAWQVGIGEAPDADLEDVRSEVLQAMDEKPRAVIHFAVDDTDPDPAATVRAMMKEYGENNVHWAVHADKSTLPEDLQKLPVLMTASATPEHTPSIKAFEGSEQQADDEEWFAGAKAKMTDAQWEAFGAYDATLVAPLGYKDGTIVIGRGGCNISYVADYYKLMRKWFNENITDKGTPGNEAPEGWKS